MGADGFNGTVNVDVDLRQSPDSAYDQAISKGFHLFRQYMKDGTNNADCIYSEVSGSIAGAGTYDLDLQTALDGFGDALTAGGVAIFVFSASASNVDNIQISPQGANLWTGLMGSGSALKLLPGSAIMGFATSTAAGTRWNVGAGSKTLRLTNMSAGTAATYTLLFATFTS